MTKRFIEFMTQNSDDGELNCGFSDIVENEWYHTKDRVNAKKCVDLLNNLIGENEQLKQHNQQITKVLEDGGVILTKNQLNSIIEMKTDDSVEVRHLKTANAKLKDEIRALREYIQKRS